MQCPQCGTVLPDGTQTCPACGRSLVADQPATGPAPRPAPDPAAQIATGQTSQAAPAEPAPATEQQPATEASAQLPPDDGATRKRRHAGLVIGIVIAVIVLLGGGAAAFLLLLPATRTTTQMPPAYAPVKVPTSITETSAADAADADKKAAENAVGTFYATINTGDFAALAALVTSDTTSAVDPGAFEGWTSTTFTVVRSALETDTAYVYGHESRRAFGSKTLGVKFTLFRVGGAWLIHSWQAVDEGAVNGAMPSTGQGSGATSLSADTAHDVVDTLLQARQKGDADTIRLLTTAKFQQVNGAVWLDGVDNSAYFTGYKIVSEKKKGAAFVVTAKEDWNSGTETATYTVVYTFGAVLVDSWTSK